VNSNRRAPSPDDGSFDGVNRAKRNSRTWGPEGLSFANVEFVNLELTTISLEYIVKEVFSFLKKGGKRIKKGRGVQSGNLESFGMIQDHLFFRPVSNESR
jgi:hypothetical protein